MAEAITVAGGGVTSVAAEEIEAIGALLQRLADEVRAATFDLASIDRTVTMYSLDAMNAPPSAARAELEIDQAQHVLNQIRDAAATLGWTLQCAADGYILAEGFVDHLFRSGLSNAAWLGGLLARASPAVGVGVAATFGATAVAAGINPQVRSDPAFVAAVRELLMYVDDAFAGFAGIPFPAAQLLGDEGLGIAGLHSVAAVLGGVGSTVGLVRSTPPRLVSASEPQMVAPATGAVQRFERIPIPSEDDGAQVVVERYEIPGESDVFVAYAAGTVTFDPFAMNEPFDSESNLINAAHDSSASADAVRQALHAAGAGPDSRVQLVGYSQGGASQARVATSGDFDVRGVLTFGSPTGQISMPTEIPVVIVEHTDDLVPALGGRQDNTEAVVVTRQAYDGAVPNGEPIPAHLRQNYVETARLMDGTDNPKLRESLNQFDDLLKNATTVTSTRYEFERDVATKIR